MKLLVITGGSRGIGLASVREFLRHSYCVVNISRTPCPVESIFQVSMDLENISMEKLGKVVSLMEKASEIVLLHNASLLLKDRVETIQPEELEKVLAVNVVAPCRLNTWALPWLCKKEGSSILYVGSTLSERGVPNSFSYVTTKHSQAGMMRATCSDLMGKGVHTALICPGVTDTDMLRTHVGHDPKLLEAMARDNSYGRLIEPSEIAETLYFAATHPVVNGSVIHVNLGQK